MATAQVPVKRSHKKLTHSRIHVEPDKKKANWDLMNDGIKQNPLYKKPYNTKRVEAALIIKENCEKTNNIVPGQLVYFNYFEPKTKEDLEYYDATPCTIYFCNYNSKQGPRVIGFNLHYYPPKIRYKIMTLIYKLFTPMFKQTWENGVKTEAQFFNYKFIIEELEKDNLQFGVRQYDPRLMSETHLIPTKWLSTAMFTEGNFKKETRQQILSYWKTWSPDSKKQREKLAQLVQDK